MDLIQVGEWLKSTVLEIIILGAIGSMVCVAGLKLAKHLLKRADIMLFSFLGKRAALTENVISLLATENQNIYAFFWAISKIIQSIASTTFCFALALVNLVYFSNFGISNSFSSGLLITAQFISIYEAISGFAYVVPLVKQDNQILEHASSHQSKGK